MGKIDPTADAAEKKEEDETKTSIKVDKSKYNKSKAASGSSSLNNGDEVAVAMAGMDLEEAQVLADKFIGENDFRTRYSALNAGMQRMNIGNRIRGHIKKADILNKDKTVKTTGLEVFHKVSKPLMAIVTKREAAEQKEKEAKAKKAKAEKAKAEKAKAADKEV